MAAALRCLPGQTLVKHALKANMQPTITNRQPTSRRCSTTWTAAPRTFTCGSTPKPSPGACGFCSGRLLWALSLTLCLSSILQATPVQPPLLHGQPLNSNYATQHHAHLPHPTTTPGSLGTSRLPWGRTTTSGAPPGPCTASWRASSGAPPCTATPSIRRTWRCGFGWLGGRVGAMLA